MKAKKSIQKKQFIGRENELRAMEKIGASSEAVLLIVYGRRRVGKTELIEHAYSNRNLLKFEGIEGYKQTEQQKIVMQQLAEYTKEPLLREVRIDNWIDVFRHIHQYTQKGTWTIYFEEVQWLSDYKADFIAELKYAWDNFFRHNPHIVLILCGSATSFMINDVVRSKALYNRSQYEIHLQEFSLKEASVFFKNRSFKEVMDSYLSVGGIPEYLKRLREKSSIFLSLCNHSFKADSFFSKEYERIFISNFAKNKHYREIINFLSIRKFASREEILSHLNIKSGGKFSELIEDLTMCGFIDSYTPYYLTNDSKLLRYCIKDSYLQFYYKFIHPIEKDIQQGIYNENPEKAINDSVMQKWLGFAFERFCRSRHHLIAKILEFSGVRYKSGSYYSRSTIKEEPDYQLDLVFDRDDNVITLCEIKYLRAKVSSKVIQEFERKLQLFPNKNKKTYQKVLISAFGAELSLEEQHYFDAIITLEDLFKT